MFYPSFTFVFLAIPRHAALSEHFHGRLVANQVSESDESRSRSATNAVVDEEGKIEFVSHDMALLQRGTLMKSDLTRDNAAPAKQERTSHKHRGKRKRKRKHPRHTQTDDPGSKEPQLLYGTPKVGIAADWEPYDVDDPDPSCSVLALNTWHYQSSPLLCSTGGYDRCPRSIRCGDPFWSKEFVVSVTEKFHNITKSPSANVSEKYDVVMLDWDGNNFFSSEKDEAIKTFPHQSRSTLTMEASQMHPMITEHHYAMNHFDFSYGFHNGLMTEQTSYLVSDPRVLYDEHFVPFEEREDRALVTTCVGSAVGERGHFVLALGEKISTHHLCGLGSNTSSRAPPDARLPEPTFDYKFRFSSDGPREKVKRFGKYKFCVAYENAIEEGYATEKLFDALRAGCIPIYKGAPDLKSLWHYADQSVLFVDDYPTMDALVARIHQIAANKTLWESFLAWKRKPVPQPVMKHLFHGLGNVACRACVRHWQKRPSYDKLEMLERARPEVPDWWKKDARVVAPGVNSTAWTSSGAYFSGP